MNRFPDTPEKRARLCLLVFLFLGSLFIYRRAILGQDLLVFRDAGGDTLDLYVPQFCTLVNHIKDGTFSFWDFSYGMGTNLFMLNLFDPFTVMTVIFGLILGTAHMLIYLVLFQVIRILAAGYLFYLFLSEHSFSPSAKAGASACFAFSGYLLVWGQHYSFGTAVPYFALVLLFAERFLKGKKSGRFLPLAVFFCGIYSVYFTYMILAGVSLYVLGRILMDPEKGFRLFFSYCLQILAGLLLSMVVFLPTAWVITGVSSRLQEGARSAAELLKSLFAPLSLKYYRVFFERLFSSNLANVSDLGDSIRYLGLINYYEDPVLFCSGLTVILDMQFLFCLPRFAMTKREKVISCLITGFLCLTVFTGFGSIVFNGFTAVSFRYTFLLLLPMLLAAACIWDELRSGMKPSLAAMIITLAGMAWALRQGWKNSAFSEYRVNTCILAAAGAVMSLVLLIMWWKKKKGKDRETGQAFGRQSPVCIPGRPGLTGAVVGLALCLQLLSEGSTCFAARIPLHKTDAADTGYPETAFAPPQSYFGQMYREDVRQALSWLREKDPGFFRVEKDFSCGTLCMDSMIQDYRGVSMYNSVMNGNLRLFLKTCFPWLRGRDPNHLIFTEGGADNWMASFLGVKYLLSLSDDLDPQAWQHIYRTGGVSVYENTYETGICRFYSQAFSPESLLDTKAGSKTQKRMLSQAITLDGAPDVSEKLEKSYSHPSDMANLVISGRDSRITGRVDAPEDGWLMFMIPFEQGWKLEIDGEKTELQKGDLAFLACRIPEGEHEIRLAFTPPGLLPGIVLSIAGLLLWIVLVRIHSVRIHSGSSSQER